MAFWVLLCLVLNVLGRDLCAHDTCTSNSSGFGKTCCCVTPYGLGCTEASFTLVSSFSNPSFEMWTILSHFYFMDAYETNNRMIIVAIRNPGHPSNSFLVLINGVELCPNTVTSIHQLEAGTRLKVKHIISPGDWHYLFLPQYLQYVKILIFGHN